MATAILSRIPRTSALPRDLAMELAATEYGRMADVVREIPADAWSKPTNCTEWTVHSLVAHVVGMAAMAASVVENVRQQRLASQRDEPVQVDALTAVQVARFGPRTSAELVGLMAEIGPRAARARRRMPRGVRALTMPGTQKVNGVEERWKMGYLVDVILTRDPWMHRIDLSRVTGRPLVLTPEHDGRIVADVVEEWAGRHGLPCRLTLSGPAGGTWVFGANPVETIELDAVEFCRILSRRAPGSGLLATEVPF